MRTYYENDPNNDVETFEKLCAEKIQILILHIISSENASVSYSSLLLVLNNKTPFYIMEDY